MFFTRHFNPRFPRGKRLLQGGHASVNNGFQSTLPAGEATSRLLMQICTTSYFNPRFPRGKRRSMPLITPISSTHTPRVPRGKRRLYTAVSAGSRHFNPRFPRGKRPSTLQASLSILEFQSTLPAGEATHIQAPETRLDVISIHASRGGSDLPTLL